MKRDGALRPEAGIRVSSSTPAGILARSSSSAAIRPVAAYSAILAAIEAPTPGMARRPLASSWPISSPQPRTDRAAFS